eukprot:TRINITY_DN10981_c0_g2_i2.p1 TRINITY_DN10981_c0_g2~~TRINITY_DN10981_c0_g2_i2.p1  ORF type:complete len:979 (+),score=115.69 TRINITY_DN10981_c0_g2_i2:250-2937(+)
MYMTNAIVHGQECTLCWLLVLPHATLFLNVDTVLSLDMLLLGSSSKRTSDGPIKGHYYAGHFGEGVKVWFGLLPGSKFKRFPRVEINRLIAAGAVVHYVTGNQLWTFGHEPVDGSNSRALAAHVHASTHEAVMHLSLADVLPELLLQPQLWQHGTVMMIKNVPQSARIHTSDFLFLLDSQAIGPTLSAASDRDFLASLDPQLEHHKFGGYDISGITVLLDPKFADLAYVHGIRVAFADSQGPDGTNTKPLGFGVNYTGRLEPGSLGLGRDRTSVNRYQLLLLLQTVVWQHLVAHLTHSQLTSAAAAETWDQLPCTCGQPLLACIGGCKPSGPLLRRFLVVLLNAIQNRSFSIVIEGRALDIHEQFLTELLWEVWRSQLPASDCTNVLPFKPGQCTKAQKQELRLLDTNPVDVDAPLIDVLQQCSCYVSMEQLWARFYDHVRALPEFGNASPFKCDLLPWPSSEWAELAQVIRNTFDQLLGSAAPGDSIRFKSFHTVETADKANAKPVICLRTAIDAVVEYFIIDVKLIETDHVHATLSLQGHECDAKRGGKCVCIEDFITSHIFTELKASSQDELLTKAERTFRRHFFASLGHQGVAPPNKSAVNAKQQQLIEDHRSSDSAIQAGDSEDVFELAPVRNNVEDSSLLTSGAERTVPTTVPRSRLKSAIESSESVLHDVVSVSHAAGQGNRNDLASSSSTHAMCVDINDIPAMRLLLPADVTQRAHGLTGRLALYLAEPDPASHTHDDVLAHNTAVSQQLHLPGYRRKLEFASNVIFDIHNALMPEGASIPRLYDYAYSLQAFNDGPGQIYFNIHLVDVLLDTPIDVLLSEWYVTYCHELAHNVELQHNQRHESAMQVLTVRSLSAYNLLHKAYCERYALEGAVLSVKAVLGQSSAC